MLENIKSLYFIKNIFLKMNERTKFKIIKYNKHMQNIININLLKNIIVVIINQFLKENLQMEKEMEKERNIIVEVI